MKNLLQSGAAWTRGTMLEIAVNLDPEVLQWPGGSVVAVLLSICAAIAAACCWDARQATNIG
jgi:hypothetical protein